MMSVESQEERDEFEEFEEFDVTEDEFDRMLAESEPVVLAEVPDYREMLVRAQKGYHTLTYLPGDVACATGAQGRPVEWVAGSESAVTSAA